MPPFPLVPYVWQLIVKSYFVKYPLFLLILLLFVRCSHSDNRINPCMIEGVLLCDAESRENTRLFTNQPGLHLRGNFLQDSTKSLSGLYSLALCRNHSQGFSFEMVGAKYPDALVLKVWRYIGGHSSDLSIGTRNGGQFYSSNTGMVRGDWEELQVEYRCPREADKDTLLIQCFFNGGDADTAWFDDFSCELLTYQSTALRFSEALPTLALSFSKSAWSKLERKREKALDLGLLVKSKGDRVEADLDGFGKVRVRLKGDWPDHLKGEKWSMRIETQDSLWEDMSKFSIQSPLSRKMLNEWIFHEWLAEEGVVTPKYFFIPTWINGDVKGVMAVEEHFTPQMLKHNHRIPGPILKFDEDLMWDMRALHWTAENRYPLSAAAEVKVFNRKSFLTSPAQEALMSRGRYLLYAHQHDLLPLDSIFDVELLAKYYAIADVLGASHSYIWHNTRYYYHPEKDVLEPVGFDGNPTLRANASDLELLDLLEHPLVGNNRMLNLLSSVHFKSSYLLALQQYSDSTCVEAICNRLQVKGSAYLEMLQVEYEGCKFPAAQLQYRASVIRERLNKLDFEDLISLKIQGSNPWYKNCERCPVPFPQVSVTAHFVNSPDGLPTLVVSNFHCEGLNVVLDDKNLYVPAAEVVKRRPSIAFFPLKELPEKLSFIAPSHPQPFKLSPSKYSFPLQK